MKNIKRISAFISAVLITANCCYPGRLAEAVTEAINSSDNDTAGTINWDQLSDLNNATVSDKTYNGNNDAAVDLTPLGISSAEEYHIPGVAEGDDVQLTAEAFFDTPDAGENKNVTIRFGLKGADADKYHTDSSTYEITRTASIKKAVVKLIPDPHFNYIFCGADVPLTIPFTMAGDMASETEHSAFSLSPDCTGSETTGAYSYSIINNGNENANIDLVTEGNFYVIERPEISSEPTVSGNEITGCAVTVHAPSDADGAPLYRIGKTADDMDNSAKVYVTEDNTIEFLIGHNSSEISSVKYRLKNSEYDIPADSASIEAADGSSLNYVTLKDPETGEDKNLLVTNKALKINIKAAGNEVLNDNKAVLKNGEDTYEPSSSETVFDSVSGTYTYSYSFDIDDTDDSEEHSYSFDLEKTDITGNTFTKKVFFRNDASQTETCNVVVDKKKPKKGNILISYYNTPFRYRKNDQDIDTAGFFIAEGTVTDTGSGIAKIEYLWDEKENDSALIEYGSGTVNYDNNGRQMFEASGCNEYHKGKEFGPYIKERKTQFQILVPYSESVPLTSGWNHKLTLVLTDNAGNTRKISANDYLNDNTIMDSKPPVVTKVKMSSENGVASLPSGNYANGAITFKVSAEDEGDSEDYSGITEYALLYSRDSSPERFIGRDSDWKNRYGYIDSKESEEDSARLKLSQKNKLYSGTFFSVFDQNLSEKCSLKDALGTESDDIIIDTVAPHVTSDISQAKITHDNTERYVWFKEGQITINADDTYQRGDASGIRKIVLKKDDSKEKTVTDNSKDPERKISDSYSVDVSGLEEGMHTYSFYAIDNAGNTSDEKEISFGIDNGAPSCSIEADDPVYGENWFRENDDFTISIDLSDSISGIDRQSVSVTVNGVKIHFDEDHISTEKNDLIYTLSKKDHLKNVPLDSDQCYHIEVNACDYAGNELAADAVKTFDVHIDRYAPWINELTVSKTDMTDPEKNITVSKHGIFANTGIKLTVSAFDSSSGKRELPAPRYNRNESQIKSVYITFDDGTKKELEPVTNGNDPRVSEFVFTIPLPKKGKSYKKRFSLTVCDNTGRKCSTDYVIRTLRNNADGSQSFDLRDEKNIDLVIEEKAPSVTYTLPEAMYEEKITENGSEEKKRFWFSEEAPAEIIYTVSDEDSGLRSVVIKENGTVLSADDSNEKQKILTAEMSENADTIDCSEHKYKFIVSADHGTDNISGVHRYEITAEDNAGNRSTPVEYEYYIDSQKPKITGAGFPSAGSNEEKEIPAESFSQEAGDVLNYSIFYKDAFTAKIYVDDEKASSGLRELNYKLITDDAPEDKAVIHTEKIVSDNNGRKYAPVSIPDGFKGRISAEVCDNVNNSSGYCTLSSAIISESEKPVIDISMGENGRRYSDGNALYTEDASVRVVIKDLKSGLKSWRVNINSESAGDAQQNIITQVTDGEYKVGDIIGSGWQIDQMDANLITAVSKTFVFDSDDNNISLDIETEDNCGNTDTQTCESFTVDKTPPVIDVKVSEGLNGTDYYNADKKAEIYITVTERNFDPSLIKADIQNSYGTAIPSLSFSDDPSDKSVHTAVLRFGEGDYTFDIRGEDLAGHNAEVNKPFGGVKQLFVDETAPVITTNFDSFGKPGEQLYYSEGRHASISILEHNFDPSLTGIRVYRKAPGSAHDQNGFSEETYSYAGYSDWKKDPSNSDRYTLEFDTDTDSVYKLEIAPYDKAGNVFICAAGTRPDTEVYEIDTTAPEVINKNGTRVSGEKNALEFLDIYTPERADAEAPTVEFDDINFDHLRCTIKKFVPKYNDRNELGTIGMEEYSEDITDRMFTLNGFDDDGIYSAEIYAYDKAGNRSLLNRNTYVKMMNSSILAYIPNSDIEAGTGLFSFEYADGTPISKRPDDFSDINITVMSTTSSDKKIVLRDMNGDETDTELYPDSVNTDLYGITICNYTLKADFFKNNYQNDTDKELILTVKDNGERMDLGRIHIDNIKPEAVIPSELRSWKWYPGKDERTIVLTDISEILDTENCKIYDNDTELPFDYSEENKTLSFSITEGWHNIGIHLVDTAGNAFDMQEAENICVGNFWSWVIGGAAAAAASAAGLMMLKKRKRRKNHLNF